MISAGDLVVSLTAVSIVVAYFLVVRQFMRRAERAEQQEASRSVVPNQPTSAPH